MENSSKNTTSLFDVFLRLRPPHSGTNDRFLDVDESTEGLPTHITLRPPSDDHRKRAIEKFAFTQVFGEDATQLDVFNGTSIVPLVEGVLGKQGRSGRDGLLATLGVTGSGKSHTILGTKSQRGLTQMTLDLLFKSIGENILRSYDTVGHLAASDVSEALLLPAGDFFQIMYGGDGDSRVNSRAQTPMTVSTLDTTPTHPSSLGISRSILGLITTLSPQSAVDQARSDTIKPVNGAAHVTRSVAKMRPLNIKESNWTPICPVTPARRGPPRPSNLPRAPSLGDSGITIDGSAQYAVVVSMYEVYNDRIYDLLTGSATHAKTPAKGLQQRRPLLFKSTECSPDRKVVAGLRKVVCETFDEALLVLETGLTERRVAGTGSNAVSSRSHGFVCLEVKKKSRSGSRQWSSSTLTIVDLAGSERARSAKTAGATLAEAGKINESLMYLGQCMQMQSDNSNAEANAKTAASFAGLTNATKPSLVPFRQCKLTELLFSNSFPNQPSKYQHQTNPPQKSVMIVTADPGGDFNATSQILRYSALAREVTVPRIPSVTSTILANGVPAPSSRPNTADGEHKDVPDLSELSRLGEEIALLREQLAQETKRRREAEASWARAEQRLQDVEADVRDECWGAFEASLARERERWTAAWSDERGRVEGFADKKVEVLVRGLSSAEEEGEVEVGEDAEVWRDRAEALERENETLMEKVNGLERERMASRTPSRKVKVLKARAWNMDEEEGQENINPL